MNNQQLLIAIKEYYKRFLNISRGKKYPNEIKSINGSVIMITLNNGNVNALPLESLKSRNLIK